MKIAYQFLIISGLILSSCQSITEPTKPLPIVVTLKPIPSSEPRIFPTTTKIPTKFPTLIPSVTPEPIPLSPKAMQEKINSLTGHEIVHYVVDRSGKEVIIKETNGREVYEMRSTNSNELPRIAIGDVGWKNYIFSFDFKFLSCNPKGNLGCTVIVTFRNVDGESYVLLIKPKQGNKNGIVLLDFGGKNGWEVIKNGNRATELNIEQNKWHKVIIAVDGDAISVSVDETWTVAVTDDRLKLGGVGISLGPDAVAQFDIVRAWNIP